MATDLDLSRMSLRKDKILELHLDKMPQPPPEMMKLPGVAAWWKEMVLLRERDQNALYELVNNLSSLVNPP